MRKIGFRCECGDVDSPCRPCARAAASSVARRAVLATLACLVTCLPLHMGISPLSSSAYAATMPVGSPQTDPSLGFHDSYTYKGSRCVHSGVDISAAAGSAVKAPVDAVVSFVVRCVWQRDHERRLFEDGRRQDCDAHAARGDNGCSRRCGLRRGARREFGSARGQVLKGNAPSYGFEEGFRLL